MYCATGSQILKAVTSVWFGLHDAVDLQTDRQFRGSASPGDISAQRAILLTQRSPLEWVTRWQNISADFIAQWFDAIAIGPEHAQAADFPRRALLAPSPPEEMDTAIDSIRAAIDSGLSASDDALAHAILADDARQGLQHLQKAFEADPFSPITWRLLVTYSYLDGGIDALKRQFAIYRCVFPEDPNVTLADAIFLAAKGDGEAAVDLTNEAAGVAWTEGFTSSARQLVKAIAGVAQITESVDGEMSVVQRMQLMAKSTSFLTTLVRLRREFDSDSIWSPSFFPIVARPVRPLSDISPSHVAAAFFGFRRSAKSLASAVEPVARTLPTADCAFTHIPRRVLADGGKRGLRCR